MGRERRLHRRPDQLLPNVPGSQYPLDWSTDGTRLAVHRSPWRPYRPWCDRCGRLGATAVRLSSARMTHLRMTVPACRMSRCSRLMARAWHTRSKTERDSGESQVLTSAIVILDLATGEVTELGSRRRQRTRSGSATTAANQGQNGSPTWSEDGRRLIFRRGDIGPLVGDDCQQATLMVNVDGSDLETPPGAR